MGKWVTILLIAALTACVVTVTAAQMGGMHGGMGQMHGQGMMQMHRPSQPITMMMNGQMMRLDAPVMMMGDRVMVPMRSAFQGLGAQVKWDNTTQTVTGTKGDKEVKLTVGKPEATVDGNAVRLETPPQMYQNRVYVPLRFIGESLGARVAWDPSAHQVRIAAGSATAASVPTAVADPPAAEPQEAGSGDTVASGKVIYADNKCSSCHKIAGKGGKTGPDLSHVGSKLSAEAIEARVRKGGGGMPAFSQIPEKDMEALSAYLKSLK